MANFFPLQPSSNVQINDGTDTLLINTNGSIINNIALPDDTQSVINIAGTGNGATQNAYTVTTGKTFYLFGINIDHTAAWTLYKNDGSTIVLMENNFTDAPAQVISPVPIAVYTSTQVVKINATNLKKYNLWGIEK